MSEFKEVFLPLFLITLICGCLILFCSSKKTAIDFDNEKCLEYSLSDNKEPTIVTDVIKVVYEKDKGYFVVVTKKQTLVISQCSIVFYNIVPVVSYSSAIKEY